VRPPTASRCTSQTCHVVSDRKKGKGLEEPSNCSRWYLVNLVMPVITRGRVSYSLPAPLSLLLPRLLADPLPIIADPVFRTTADPVPRTTADHVPCTAANPVPRPATDPIPPMTADTTQDTVQLQMISLKSVSCLVACYVRAAFDIVNQPECSATNWLIEWTCKI